MRRLKHSVALLLIGLFVSSSTVAGNSWPLAGSQLEIAEVRNVGASASNEAHSIIQVSWKVGAGPEVKIRGFELQLEATYADGALEKAQSRTNGTARSSRFEVPTLHRSPGGPAAEIKSFKVTVTATYSETVSIQVSPNASSFEEK